MTGRGIAYAGAMVAVCWFWTTAPDNEYRLACMLALAILIGGLVWGDWRKDSND